MISAAILALSTVLQLVAAALAVRLVFLYGRYLAWTLISIALLLMATRRIISLHALVDTYLTSNSWPVRPGAEAAEIVALFISAAMLAGVMLIAPLFHERETTTAALRDTEATFRGILENSTDVFLRSDASGCIDMVSDSVRSLVGYSPDEIMGRKVADLHADPRGREVFLNALRAADGRLRNYEANLLHRDGSIVRVSTSTSTIVDDAGNVMGIQGIVRNITDERRAEQLNARLGRILEGSINEVYVYDSETLRFLMVNRAALDNLGWTLDEILTLTPSTLSPISRRRPTPPPSSRSGTAPRRCTNSRHARSERTARLTTCASACSSSRPKRHRSSSPSSKTSPNIAVPRKSCARRRRWKRSAS